MWIEVNGKKIDLLNPDPDLILIEDIAMSLSKLCRFGGHCNKFYSVATHSIIMASYVNSSYFSEEYGITDYDEIRSIYKECLFHDASEAYVGDISSPLKSLLPEFKEIEEGFTRAIYTKFGVQKNQHTKLLDYRILLNEKKLLTNSAHEWELEKRFEPLRIDISMWVDNMDIESSYEVLSNAMVLSL